MKNKIADLKRELKKIRAALKQTPLSIATFDLETTSLHADFGILLCAVVKQQGCDPIVFRGDILNKKWKTNRSNDSEILKHVAKELFKHDILIAHNGCRFDIPFLRTRLAKWNLPPLPDKKILDPVLLARRKLRMSYNGLEKIAKFYGVNSKSDVTGDMWLRASLDGDKTAMDYIVKHCIEDVITLEKVVLKIKDYSKQINTWGSSF